MYAPSVVLTAKIVGSVVVGVLIGDTGFQLTHRSAASQTQPLIAATQSSQSGSTHGLSEVGNPVPPHSAGTTTTTPTASASAVVTPTPTAISGNGATAAPTAAPTPVSTATPTPTAIPGTSTGTLSGMEEQYQSVCSPPAPGQPTCYSVAVTSASNTLYLYSPTNKTTALQSIYPSADGKFQVTLAPGNYILDIAPPPYACHNPECAQPPVRPYGGIEPFSQYSKTITITAGATTSVTIMVPAE